MPIFTYHLFSLSRIFSVPVGDSKETKTSNFPLTSVRPVIRHKNPRGKLIHPSQGQELESAGRITDQTENSISCKKCEKVLYVTVIHTTTVVRTSHYAICGDLMFCISIVK